MEPRILCIYCGDPNRSIVSTHLPIDVCNTCKHRYNAYDSSSTFELRTHIREVYQKIDERVWKYPSEPPAEHYDPDWIKATSVLVSEYQDLVKELLFSVRDHEKVMYILRTQRLRDEVDQLRKSLERERANTRELQRKLDESKETRKDEIEFAFVDELLKKLDRKRKRAQ